MLDVTMLVVSQQCTLAAVKESH